MRSFELLPPADLGENFLLAGCHAFSRSREQNEIYSRDVHAIGYLLSRLGAEGLKQSQFQLQDHAIFSPSIDSMLNQMEGRLLAGIDPSNYFSGLVLFDEPVMHAREALNGIPAYVRIMRTLVKLIEQHPTSYQLTCLCCTDMALTAALFINEKTYSEISGGLLRDFPFEMVVHSHSTLLGANMPYPEQAM